MNRHSAIQVVAAALLVLAPSCAGTTEIKGKSSDMLFPVLRTQIEFGGERRTTGRRSRGLIGMEVELSGGSDEFQPRDPAFAEADFDIIDIHAAFRGGVDIDDRLRIEGLAGLEFSRFALDFGRLNQQRESETTTSIGPVIGAQMTLDVVERLAVYGRVLRGFGFAETENEKLEVGFTLEVSPQTNLLLGYRWWTYQDEELNLGLVPTRNLDLDMSGFIIGMDVVF